MAPPADDPQTDQARFAACAHDVAIILERAVRFQGAGPDAIVTGFAEALCQVLGASFVYIRAEESLVAEPVEAVRGSFAFVSESHGPSAAQAPTPDRAREVGQWLSSWLRADASTRAPSIEKLTRDGQLHLATAALGRAGKGGVIVAGAERADFADAAHTMILHVAAQQASLLLDNQRLLSERNSADQELADFLENAVEGLKWLAPDGTILWANNAELELLGYAREEYVGQNAIDFGLDRADMLALIARIAGGETVHGFEARLLCKDGSIRHVILGADVRRHAASFVRTRCFTLDITEKKRSDGVRAAELEMLGRIERGASLQEALEVLTHTLETLSGEMIASVLLLDESGKHVMHGAAPSLPEAYNRAIHGQPIGPRAGSCGTAAYRKEQVIVTDIASDPLWADYREVALPFGLRACWSTPILSPVGDVLGTFALYYRTPRAPRPEHLTLIATAVSAARAAIERHRAVSLRNELLTREKTARTRAEALVKELSRGMRYRELFNGILGHDLRNPLTSIISNAETLGLRNPDATSQKAIARVLSSAERMSRMISQLLDFTRVRGAGMPITRRHMDMLALCEQVVGELEASYPGRSIELSSDGDVSGEWDEDRLGQVVSNLVGNALQHGATDSSVRVRLDGTAERMVTLEVENTGYINATTQAWLFDPFRSSREGRDGAQGLGLGLFITRQIVRGHGGDVTVASSEAEGTSFRVSLPRKAMDCELADNQDDLLENDEVLIGPMDSLVPGVGDSTKP